MSQFFVKGESGSTYYCGDITSFDVVSDEDIRKRGRSVNMMSSRRLIESGGMCRIGVGHLIDIVHIDPNELQSKILMCKQRVSNN